jgi:uncharacterized membrane protein
MIEKISVSDVLTIAGLVAALILAIFFGMNELAMSIASGLLGYIGGNIKTMKGGDTNGKGN